ncbi:hypothetical protein KY290_037417 [Solanum tuberosum]|uniref:Retrotransposon Copia-like N-terminal domain-containing protein n=1 Tax=Solanum tuberosum TaxID=4113 RepID=A0ABQ7TVH5_SOLTU|nr:hypothetical protein KY290_037417 [Solanum tuberosum]
MAIGNTSDSIEIGTGIGNGDNTAAPTPIDSNNPLYMHPSDNPGAMLVPVQFTGLGYRSWRRSVLRSLSVKNKLGFITGECSRPRSDHHTYRQWERCDDIVTSWILNSLSKEIADSVEYVQNSAELWKELEDRYEQTNGAKLYQIQREINDLSQGSLDITAYYTKLKKLWEELSTLNVKTQCTCSCVCGAKESVYKGEQDRRLVQFLMGLNEIYTAIRGSILMMNPLPSMAQTFSLLVQDEHQREIKPSNHLTLDSTALHAGIDKPTHYKTNYSTNNLKYKDMFCNYCKRTGHLMEKCYQLHGYPPGHLLHGSSPGHINNSQNSNFSLNQNRNTQSTQRSNTTRAPARFNQYPHTPGYGRGNGGKAVANANCAADLNIGKGLITSTTGEEMFNVNLTKEEYGHLQAALQHFQKDYDVECPPTNQAFANGTVDFAGTIICTSSIDSSKLSCACFKNKSDSWILDSGASNHMTFNISLLHNVTTLPYPILVDLPNGYKVKVTQIGSVALGPMISLEKVLFVPSFKYNLISINAMSIQSHCTISFTKTSCVMQAPSMKRPLVIGRAEAGLYFLCPNCLKTLNSSSLSSISSYCIFPSCNACNRSRSFHVSDSMKCTSFLNKQNSCLNVENSPTVPLLHSPILSHTCTGNNVDVVWHNRLGHVPFVKMKSISTIPITFSSKQPFMCSICPMARQERLPFKPRTSISSQLFELVHVDLWGPYHIATHNHFKYFITIVDDFSRSTWTQLLSSKSNAL